MGAKGRDKTRYDRFSRRALIIGGAQLGAFGVLGARMYYLQIVKGEEYSTLADENRINVRLVAPQRGKIVDRNGMLLAANRENYRVLLVPEQAVDVEETLSLLGRIVPLSDFDLKRIRRDIERSPRFIPVTVAENLAWEQFAAVNVHEPDLPGLLPDVGDTRYYPWGDELSHVVGYVGAVSDRDLDTADDDPLLRLPRFKIGKSGIEKQFERSLRGSAGATRVEVNAYGRVIRRLAHDPGISGKEIQLTLDMQLQDYAWQQVKDEGAAAVAMDIHNGDVLALVSTPAYDPNAFSRGLSHAEWQALLDNPYKPLINKAIAGQYPPGSTFKMLVALAALEHGINPYERVVCRGHYTLGNHRFHCWKRWGHGAMDLKGAIKHSCDVYFYEMAKRIGIDNIQAVAHRFGLGETFGFGVPGEKPGLVPSRDWKLGRDNKPWQQGETLITGIGQGYLLATPLQLAVMTARIANGGKAVSPRIVRALDGAPVEAAPAPDMGVSPEHLAFIRDAMNAVSNEPGGTAYSARIAEPGMELAGKTGTAQVRRISKAERARGVIRNEDLERRLRDHALFVAFAPVQAPRYAVSVIVEHGKSGSGTAAPIARDIMKKLLELQPPFAQAGLEAPATDPIQADPA